MVKSPTWFAQPSEVAAVGSGEQGSASLWLVGFVLVFAVATAAVIGIGQAEVARHRVATAADLAALAAASAEARSFLAITSTQSSQGGTEGAFDGPGATPCAEAEQVALANGGRVTHCVATANWAEVTAEIAVPGLAALLSAGAAATATARAGFS